jgi:hypothetical protein
MNYSDAKKLIDDQDYQERQRLKGLISQHVEAISKLIKDINEPLTVTWDATLSVGYMIHPTRGVYIRITKQSKRWWNFGESVMVFLPEQYLQRATIPEESVYTYWGPAKEKIQLQMSKELSVAKFVLTLHDVLNIQV